ncbi:MAG: alpha/beta hydrolase [Rhodospirillaceae bacterium]|nr:alpha/beta hydrolase [Rhodospirillaceae bacterium]
MELHPQARRFVQAISVAGRPLWHLPPVEARHAYAKRVAKATVRPTGSVLVGEGTAFGPAGGIPLRTYRPAERQGERLPVVIFLHGGSFVLGGLETHDPQCRAVAAKSGCLVVSVDYRMAPEHKFPAAVDDAFAATCWLADHAASLGGDRDRMAVMGDSNGGALAAVVSHMAQDRGGPGFALTCMVCPSTDIYGDLPSHARLHSDVLLSWPLVDWSFGLYLNGPEERRDPRFAPLQRSQVAGLPPLLMVTAEADPLYDDGSAYADKLAAAGVPVEHVCFPGQVHNFVLWGGVIDAADEALDLIGNRLKAALAA